MPDGTRPLAMVAHRKGPSHPFEHWVGTSTLTPPEVTLTSKAPGPCSARFSLAGGMPSLQWRPPPMLRTGVYYYSWRGARVQQECGYALRELCHTSRYANAPVNRSSPRVWVACSTPSSSPSIGWPFQMS
jgi:hypothetical protein